MGVYLLQLFIIFLLGIILYIKGFTKRKLKIFLIVTSVILILMPTLRHITVGTDTENYFNIFETAKRLTFNQIINFEHEIESGYLFINKFLSEINGGYQLVLFFNSTVAVVPVMYYVYKNSEYPVLSVYLYVSLYFYALIYNGMRQFVALGIFLFAFEQLKKKKWYTFLIYVILILIAASIHRSALILLFGILLVYLKPTYKNLIIVGVSFTTLCLIFYFWPNTLYTLINLVVPNYVEKYIGTSFISTAPLGKSVLLWILNLFLFICSVIILYMCRAKEPIDKSANRIQNDKKQGKNTDRSASLLNNLNDFKNSFKIRSNYNEAKMVEYQEPKEDTLEELGLTKYRVNVFSSSIMVLIATGISLVSRQLLILYRLVHYFEIFLIILIPSILFYILQNFKMLKKNPKFKIIFIAAIYFLGLIYYVYKLMSGDGEIIPYSFLGQK